MIVYCALIFVSAVCAPPTSNDASAEKGKPSTLKIESGFHLATGRAYSAHANDHSKLLRKYAERTGNVPQSVQNEHAAALRRNVVSAQAAFAKLRADAKGNPSVAKKLDDIDTRLDKIIHLLNTLEVNERKDDAKTDSIVSWVKSVSEHLQAVDSAAEDLGDNFYDRDSPSYYTTGEGHYID
jgi:hypothetical protein